MRCVYVMSYFEGTTNILAGYLEIVVLVTCQAARTDTAFKIPHAFS